MQLGNLIETLRSNSVQRINGHKSDERGYSVSFIMNRNYHGTILHYVEYKEPIERIIETNFLIDAWYINDHWYVGTDNPMI